MTNDPSDDDECRTCGKTRGWHREHRPMHPFNDGQAGATAFLGNKNRRGSTGTGDNGNDAQRGSQAAPWPFDPVLRQALMDAGLITPEMLRDAENKIRAVTSQFEATTRGSRDGQ